MGLKMTISNTEWKLAKQGIKLLKRMSKKDYYLHDLATKCQEAIKEKDYQKYRKNMDLFKKHIAKTSGRTIEEVERMIKEGFSDFKKRFKK